MKKRLISLILVLVLAVSFAVPVFADGIEFTDVPENKWFYKYVTELTNAGIVNGYGDGTFKPNGTVTYGEALKLIFLAAGIKPMKATTKHWASGYLSYAVEQGYISITDADLNKCITRGEIASIALKALNLPAPTVGSPFVDTDKADAVSLYQAGIFSGSLENGRLFFLGSSFIKRSEMSAVIYRMMKLPEKIEFSVPEGAEVLEEDAEVIISCTGGLRLRKGPSTDEEYIRLITPGTRVPALYKLNGWYYVTYNGDAGYISGEYCRIIGKASPNSTELRDSIIEFAKNYIGCPYIYADEGPSSFDCSGFTKYVFKNFGMSLPHSANSQYSMGEALAQSELVRGDLVFFSNNETTGIGHVGIYIGDGDFIHASSSKGVIISNFYSGWYYDHYKAACRIIDDLEDIAK